MIRHQLPAYSPVSAKAALLATSQLFRFGSDQRSALEALIAREYDMGKVILCGSGTQALTIAIREALTRVTPDAPVALPAYSCFDVASAAVGADVRVSLYDVGPDTLAPDLESLERVLKAGAGVVVVAPLYGIPVDWDAIDRLVSRYDAVLIEDAAQGHGASWKGKRLGSLGQIATLSFGRGKGWTGGGGGALLLRTVAYERVDTLSGAAFAQEAKTSLSLVAQWIFGRPALYRLPRLVAGLALGETTYHPPINATSISRAAAAVLLSTYEASKHEANARRINSNRMLGALAENRRVTTFQPSPDAVAGYLRLPVRVRGAHRALSAADASALGLSPAYPRILGDLSQLASRLCGPDHTWPGAQTLVSDLITLPTHTRLTRKDASAVLKLLRDKS